MYYLTLTKQALAKNEVGQQRQVVGPHPLSNVLFGRFSQEQAEYGMTSTKAQSSLVMQP